ncbi:MAG: sensor histidine kinase [Deltaproteobacteria bacterium]|nr:sensor histidine kinase [Deltaproteobacteria bacterium]
MKFEVEIDLQLFPIHADRQGVEIIVANLLNNAIKYNREGGRVCVNAQNQGECVEVKVSDTGVGVKKENLPRIFDRFFRVRDEYTRMVIGSGLGLPLVKSIVEAHSGTITVVSEQNKGTTFTVNLPRSIL